MALHDHKQTQLQFSLENPSSTSINFPNEQTNVDNLTIFVIGMFVFCCCFFFFKNNISSH